METITDVDTSKRAGIFSKQALVLIISVAMVIICFDAGAVTAASDYNIAVTVGLEFDRNKDAYISSARGSMFTFLRAIVFFLTMKVHIKVIVMILLLIANFLFALTSMQQHILSDPMSAAAVETILWLGFSLIWYGFGPMYPGIISFAERYVKVSNFNCGLFVAVGGSNIVLNLAVVEKFLEQMPITQIYNILVAAIVMIIMFISIMVIVKRTGKEITGRTNDE